MWCIDRLTSLADPSMKDTLVVDKISHNKDVVISIIVSVVVVIVGKGNGAPNPSPAQSLKRDRMAERMQSSKWCANDKFVAMVNPIVQLTTIQKKMAKSHKALVVTVLKCFLFAKTCYRLIWPRNISRLWRIRER
jgi:hypothetical protein